MAIEFACPSCHGTLRVGDDAVGKVVRCGSCMTMLRVPATAPSPEPAAEEPAPRRRSAEPVAPDDRPPRRRPRRPPPKPRGNRVLLWVVLVLVLLCVLGAAACGGLFLLLGPNWRTHESVNGGFKVDLPAAPRDDMPDLARIRNQGEVKIEGTLLVTKFEEYSVIYADIQAPLRGSDDAILNEAVKGLERDTPGAKVVRDTPVAVGNFPAREVAFTHPEGGTYIARIVVADTRLYLIVAGGPQMTAIGNDRVRRFLDSFKVTDPKLLAGAKEKQELVDAGVRQAKLREDVRKREEEARKERERNERAADEAKQAGRAVGLAAYYAAKGERDGAIDRLEAVRRWAPPLR